MYIKMPFSKRGDGQNGWWLPRCSCALEIIFNILQHTVMSPESQQLTEYLLLIANGGDFEYPLQKIHKKSK